MGAWVWRIGAAVLACTASTAACAATLRLVTENGPPMNMRVGDRIIGVSTDKVREAMKRAGIKYSLELMPWKLAYSLALREPATCIYSTARSAERDASFKWIGPIYEIGWTFFARADRQLKLSSLEEARGMRIGSYKGDIPEEYLRGQGFVVDAAASGALNPGKLVAGRIDLWVTSRQGGRLIAAQNGWAEQIVPVLTFKQSDVFLACNPAVPDSIVTNLNAAFKAIRADGTGEAIERKYDNWDGRGLPADSLRPP
jgi:polar amino acid transport system substrate-binding protein